MENTLHQKATTETKTCQVALYSRVSSQEQAQHGVSLEHQKERLEQWAKLEGWEIADFYTDEGYSGGNDKRPELQRLMHDAKRGLFNVVIVTKLDRFFRNTRLLLNYIHELEQCGITFRAQQDNIDTGTPGIGKIILNLLASIGEWEKDQIGDRISEFRTKLALKGQWSSGRTPFGYRFDKGTKALVIEPIEADAIKFIFNAYLENRIGILQTAELANSTGVPTPRRGRRKHDYWTQSAIRYVLTHPAYKGGPNERWQFTTPAIMESEVWTAAQVRLSQNQHFRTLSKAGARFRGRLHCGICGHTLRVGYSHSAIPVYECPGRLRRLHLDGSKRCTLPRLRVAAVDSLVIEQIEGIVADPETFASHIEYTLKNLETERRELEARLRPLQAEAERIREDMAIIDARLEMHRISPEVYKGRMRELLNKLHNIEQRTGEADPMLLNEFWLNEGGIVMHRIFLKGLKQHGKAFMENWLSLCQGKASDIVPMTGNLSQKLINEMGAFVYPDRIALKGNIKQGQSIVTSTYKSARCPRSR